LEIRGAEPTLPCRREAIHKIIPAWIVVRCHVAESDVSKAFPLDSLGDICLAHSDSLCCALRIPPPAFVVVSAIAVRALATAVANVTRTAPISGTPLSLGPISASRIGSEPPTPILAAPLASVRSAPFQIDRIAFSTTLRVVDPKNNPAPVLPGILKKLNAPSPVDSAESEVVRIGGHSSIAHEAAPCWLLSGKIPQPAYVALYFNFGGSVDYHFDGALSVHRISGDICAPRHLLGGRGNCQNKRSEQR
jgi:hypothetical protein